MTKQISPASRPFGPGRSLLILGRVSNLPTVWSNCLAAWLIAGGGPWSRFAVGCAGGTLFYIGGMFLNDAFDVEFDRMHRPERPIPARQIARRTVWVLGALWLILGLGFSLLVGTTVALIGLLLALSIVLYDAVHKRTALAPLLMSACRFLLYLMIGAAGIVGISHVLLWRALALGTYIAGLSYLARGGGGIWPIGLLFVPVLIALGIDETKGSMTWVAAAVLVVWVLWCLRGRLVIPTQMLGKSVSGLLGGIVFVDWLAVANPGVVIVEIFLALFVLALLLQRAVPAT